METCAKKWDESMLTPLREWMAEKIVPWMVMPYARGARSGASPASWYSDACLMDLLSSPADEARSMLQGVGSRFDYHVCKTLCDLRTQEIFDIIIDYPDSQPALQDLKECLIRVDQRTDLVMSLRKA